MLRPWLISGFIWGLMPKDHLQPELKWVVVVVGIALTGWVLSKFE